MLKDIKQEVMMKQIIITIAAIMLCFVTVSAYSQQQRARTADGKEVILYPDGTWKHVETPVVHPPSSYSKPTSSNKLIKGKYGTYGIWIDDKKWKKSEVQFSPQAEYSFVHTAGDGYAMIVPERIQMPLETLKSFALKNAQKAAPDARITFEEKRDVNDNKVLCMKIKGTIQSIPFTYLGYYYAGKAGTIQVITYTAQNLFAEFESDFTKFLNGFEVYTTPQREKREVKSYTAGSQREISYDDGSKYVGDIVNGKMHGQGTYTWPSGAKYTGEWSNNMKHGQGTYIWPSGDKYVGAWENDRASGGWLYKTDGSKLWYYQDTGGNWVIKKQ